MVAAAHQAQFDLVLHVFDVKSAATGAGAHQGAHHVLGQFFNDFTHTGGCCALGAVHRQKGFHHGHGDLVGLKRDHGTVAADDLVVVEGVHSGSASPVCRQVHQAGRSGGDGQVNLHGHFLIYGLGCIGQKGFNCRSGMFVRICNGHYIWCLGS